MVILRGLSLPSASKTGTYYLGVFKPLLFSQERRISREEVDSIVAGGKTLEVEIVERYLQPQKLRPLLLRWIADQSLTKDQVEGLGLPGTLADELIALLVG